ncbi:hypothetical protein ACJZ2D_008836 [Fusarium nematophilum]
MNRTRLFGSFCIFQLVQISHPDRLELPERNSGSKEVIDLLERATRHVGYAEEGKNGFQTFENVESAPSLLNRIGHKTGILGKVHVSPASRYPQQAQAFDDSDREGRPFFLMMGFVDPHRQIGTRGGFGNDDNLDPRLSNEIFKPEDVAVPSFLNDIREVRQELAEYYRAIHRMDQGVGPVLQALERSGHAHDTLVLFLSDKGPPFVNSKTTLFDAGVRLPFIMRVPGLEGTTVNPNLVSYIDILPTFLDWAGHPQLPLEPGHLERRGRSILHIAGCSTLQPGWDAIFGSHTFHEITNYWLTRYMRSRRFKYQRNVCRKLDFPFAMDLYASLSWEAMRNLCDEGEEPMVGPRTLRDYICRPPEELYDLESDPQEVHNLAGDAEYHDTLASMRCAVEEWQRETGGSVAVEGWKSGCEVPVFELCARRSLDTRPVRL